MKTDKALEALKTAINTVECASVDLKTGQDLPWYKQAKVAIIKQANLLEALESIAENLENRAMSKEQEIAFAHNPQAESWRVYLSSLIIQARNEARQAIAKAEGK